MSAPRFTGQGWEPISSAPKDGTTILLARYAWLTDVSDLGDDPRTPEFRDRLFDENAPKVYHLCWTCGGFWSSKWNNWNDGVEPCGLADPTHWMPLPDAPTPSPSVTREGGE